MSQQLPINSLEWFDKVSRGVQDGTKDTPALIRIPILIVFYLGFPFIMFGVFVIGVPLLIVYLILSALGHAISGQGGKGPNT